MKLVNFKDFNTTQLFLIQNQFWIVKYIGNENNLPS